MTQTETEYVDSIKDGIHEAKFADYENGMATVPFTVEREFCYLKVLRKSGGLEHPTIMLFKAIPKNGCMVDLSELSADVTDALGLYGDVSVNFQDEDGRITAIVPTSIV